MNFHPKAWSYKEKKKNTIKSMQKDCLERTETKIVSHNSWLEAIL